MSSEGYKFGLALSGGGSRAAAFHLGCMRALNDRGILDQVCTLSTVSGGSVIGALWAYSDDSFDEFDVRMQAMLRKGLKSGIVRFTFLSSTTLKIAATVASSGLVSAVCSVISLALSLLGMIGVPNSALRKLKNSLQAPLPRFASRTTAFAEFLDVEYFKGATLKDIKRKNLQIVINATELRTESAYRFGSMESGCWRFGKLVDDTSVAKAVAASAAFPAILPALDDQRRYIKRGKTLTHRTIVTDGGVYDNLGTSCLIPGRNSSFSTNVTETNFIIACVAGQGIPDGSNLPYFWPARMMATINTIHRRTHSMTFDLLHRLKSSGEIQGFLLPYLGQNDSALPCPPKDLVPRDATFDYPTDFDPMSQEDLDMLALRGEQLTRNLIETYYPEL
ncbi:MAG: patatin-like phospholipase family protein [Candidatus Thiodiazotropha weberae]|nr:patatin-like phospholipase family protein [Candidatus Thiodiazotropha lotti]MCG8013488.1 patatin-like phospholipase family protein [Candidatus Thiodiazotropha lotti]MCG8020054.1 patatin-like phospholipase family protein [Candidatus Thiodiazotropha lotti]MCW4207216.1 patatin-like phospholipase family protein [Candidatus Thiodiazotropha lotti]MCW4212964.1 patatin-like phospholipase family protein [Candidatus Thiodiazotropha lotti]